MANEVLVVDDSGDQVLLIRALLEKAGLETRAADSVESALELLDTKRPDAVVTDLVMPGMNGMVLVEKVREKHPNLPVILVTAFGSGEVAQRALKKGAVSYVPKRRIMGDLVPTVESVLAVANQHRERARLLSHLMSSRFEFRLANEEILIPPLVHFVQSLLVERRLSEDEVSAMQVGVAVQEAVRNAMHHGNLEVSSELREESSLVYSAQVEKRLGQPGFARRRVTVEIELTPGQFRCVVRDEGRGFDPSAIPNPTDPENLLKTSGRGLYLIAAFMDTVRHEDSGRAIVMTKAIAKRPSQAVSEPS